MSIDKFVWKDEPQGKALYANEQCVGVIKPYVHDQMRVDDEIKETEEGVFCWTRSFHSLAFIDNIQLTMEFVVPQPMTYGMIPSVSYNGNPWGPGRDIKGFTLGGEPWTFAYHRVAVSGGTYSENANWSVALFAQEGFDGACALIPSESATIHRLILPEIETPQVYIMRDRYSAPYTSTLSLEAGATVTLVAYLVFTPVQEPRQAWCRMLNIAWKQHVYQHQPRFSSETIWKWGVEYTRESLWTADDEFCGFSMGLWWENDHWSQHDRHEIGWCGQNASLANALLYDYLRNGTRSSLERGLMALDSWATHAPLPYGLFRCHLARRGTSEAQREEVQDGCNLGAAAHYFFEAYQLSQRCGIERPNYQQIALDICDFFVAHQFADGNLGRAWSDDGVCVATDGTTGCFLIQALLDAYQIAKNADYLRTAERAFHFYMRGLLTDGFTAAGALDTHCIDKESSIPLLRSGLTLYELTADPQYLKWAEHAAYYLATWQWHHTVHYEAGFALHELAYDTFGGTSVSTQHHHQDPYGLLYVPDLFKLADLTGNPIWKQRALALWANGMIGVSDGVLTLMGKTRPIGGQDEGFYHTRWGRDPSEVSQWLVAWPTAFRLEILRNLTDWSRLD